MRLVRHSRKDWCSLKRSGFSTTDALTPGLALPSSIQKPRPHVNSKNLQHRSNTLPHHGKGYPTSRSLFARCGAPMFVERQGLYSSSSHPSKGGRTKVVFYARSSSASSRSASST